MSKTFLYADPHFSHQGVCEFTRYEGSELRPWNTREEMDEALVENFNNTVSENDKVYMLGDITMRDKYLEVLERLNCKNLVLIKGNHDIGKLNRYSRYFRDIRAYQVLNGCILSHIPIHPECLARFGVNIHGHLHSNRIRLEDGSIDPRYFCVSVEHTDFKPIDIEEVFKRVVEQGGTIGFKNGNGPS